MSTLKPILALAAVLALTPTVQAQQGYPARLDLGTAITPQELAQFFSIPADGRGLPPGKGTYAAGEKVYADRDILPRDIISQKLSVPNAERIFFIRHALRAGFSIEEIFELTKIDRWFLAQLKEIVDFEEELAGTAK